MPDRCQLRDFLVFSLFGKPPVDFDQRREHMVEQQLIARGIHDVRVLDAMRAVPREEFVPRQLQYDAYSDWPLPIGFGQTISQPYTVAFMAEALQLTGTEKVLEVGTGCGYAAAVISCVAREMHTIERIVPLADHARERLARLGYHSVQVYTGDGSLGLPDQAPFDAIVVTAGATELPPAYVAQLADNGRIVIPIGSVRHSQTLQRLTKSGEKLHVEHLGQFAFVPLIRTTDHV